MAQVLQGRAGVVAPAGFRRGMGVGAANEQARFGLREIGHDIGQIVFEQRLPMFALQPYEGLSRVVVSATA